MRTAPANGCAMSRQRTAADLRDFIDRRMPSAPSKIGTRTVYLTTAVLTPTTVADLEASAIADAFEQAGDIRKASAMRSAVSKRGRGRPPEWQQLHEWLFDDIAALLKDNVTL